MDFICNERAAWDANTWYFSNQLSATEWKSQKRSEKPWYLTKKKTNYLQDLFNMHIPSTNSSTNNNLFCMIFLHFRVGRYNKTHAPYAISLDFRCRNRPVLKLPAAATPGKLDKSGNLHHINQAEKACTERTTQTNHSNDHQCFIILLFHSCFSQW